MALNAKTVLNNELEMVWKEAVIPSLGYYSSICLEALRKTT
jgi:hypothetical protein